MPRSAEQLFGLCRVVSPLQFFKQFDATTIARLCAKIVLRPLVAGSRIYLEPVCCENALHVILEGQLSQGPWMLVPGDTFGYRDMVPEDSSCPNMTPHRCVIAKDDSLVAVLGQRDVSEILSATESRSTCFAPELARALLRRPPGERSSEDDAVVRALLGQIKFMRALGPDTRAAAGKLMTLREVEPGATVARGEDLDTTLIVVLSGALSTRCDVDADGGGGAVAVAKQCRKTQWALACVVAGSRGERHGASRDAHRASVCARRKRQTELRERQDTQAHLNCPGSKKALRWRICRGCLRRVVRRDGGMVGIAAGRWLPTARA